VPSFGFNRAARVGSRSPTVGSGAHDSLKGFSHEELLKHTCGLGGQSDQVCDGLLDDYKDQLTSYGFNSLHAKLNDDAIALLFCRNRLDLIHKHCGVLYIYVTDEDVRKQMPEAVWMLFEECQERNIYFTGEKFTPVEGQPCEKEAKEWYKRFLQSLMKDQSQMEPWRVRLAVDEVVYSSSYLDPFVMCLALCYSRKKMCALCLSGAYIFSSFEQCGVLISRLKIVQAFFH
jgi:hypothetical protein